MALGLLATASGWGRIQSLRMFMKGRDAAVDRICQRLRPHLAVNDTVLAWGWSAWGVYEPCSRWAPGPIFKDLTNVTTPNTNTCNRGYGPPRFKPGPLARRYLADMATHSPALVVLSDYYRGFGADPMDQWHDLRLFLRERYVHWVDVDGFSALVPLVLADRLGIDPEKNRPWHRDGEPELTSATGVADEFWGCVAGTTDPRW